MVEQFLRKFSVCLLAGIIAISVGFNVSAEESENQGNVEKLLVDTRSGEAYYKEVSGTWNDSDVKGYGGNKTRYSLSPNAAAEWYPVVAEEGEYTIKMYHPIHTSDVTNDVKITVTDLSGVTLHSEEIIWDGTEQNGWITLGEYRLTPGKYIVKLEKMGKEENPNSPGSHDQSLRADAVEFVRMPVSGNEELLPEVGAGQELIIDYGENGYTETGRWMESNLKGYNETKSRYTFQQNAAAEWKAKIVQNGDYEIWTYQIGSTSNSKSVEFSLTAGDESITEIEDWSSVKESGWKLRGEYQLHAGDICNIKITNVSSDSNKYMRADAVRIRYKQELDEIVQKGIYYVDASSGDDNNTGTSPKAAWKTLDKVNSISFAPGSQILLKKGETWTGRLAPKGSGTKEEVITLGSYGEGDKRPVINGNGCTDGAVGFYNQEYWEITGLEVTNWQKGEEFGNQETYDKNKNQSIRHGIYVELENFDTNGDNTAEHIYVKDCYVHDVIGNLGNPHNGVGIFYFVSDSKDKSRFHDVKIAGNDVRNIDRSGIIIRSQDTSNPDVTYNTGIVIEDNYLENIAGDGIVAKVSKNALIQYNEVNEACTRATGGNVNNAAVWVWQCKDSVIQYNEVYNTGLHGGNKDGQAFDSDFNCEGCVIQYNYSHNNDGGFVLLIAPSSNDFNRGTVVRYNISENDKKDVLEISGEVENAQIYNNTIYQSEDCSTNLLRVNTYFGIPESALILNNIFHSDAENTTTMRENDNGRPYRGSITFDHNLFYGFPVLNSVDREVDETVGGILYQGHWKLTVENSLSGDSFLKNPGKGTTGIDFTDMQRLSEYQLKETSPAVDAGVIIEGSGGVDFCGVSLDNKPDIGACEYVKGDVPENSEDNKYSSGNDTDKIEETEKPEEKAPKTGDTITAEYTAAFVNSLIGCHNSLE